MIKTYHLALLVALLNFHAPAAIASEYGCKVILCLANPDGPKAVAECVPPINKLYHDLSKGKPFPTCEEAGPNTRIAYETTWAACPQGTVALNNPQSGVGIWGNQVKYCGPKAANSFYGTGAMYGLNNYNYGSPLNGINGIGLNNRNIIAIQPDRGLHVYVDNLLLINVKNQ